jgi:hypothetical protein
MLERSWNKFMATDCSTASEVLKTLIQVVSVALGWYVVHRLSVARDRDKARRDLLVKAADSLSDDAGKLLSVARDYHTKNRDRAVEDTIKMTLQDISARTNLLSEISLEAKELASCRSAILAFKKAITATHFEDEHEATLEPGAPQLQSIAAEGLKVKQCYLKLKHKQFPSA